MNQPSANNQPRNPNTPNQEIEEITFSLVGNNLNPMILTHEFLTSSGIVPRNWELSKQPVTSQRMSQINFQNGVTILAQPGTINFVEGLNPNKEQELNSPNLVLEYIDRLPHAEYQRMSINPKNIVPFPNDEPDAARKFITEVLLSSGPWKEFGLAPLQAGLNLSYQLEKSILTLSINEAKIQLPNKSVLPALLFSGSFNYSLSGDDDDLKIAQLKEQISSWQSDLATFREIVKEKFLQKPSKPQESLFSTM